MSWEAGVAIVAGALTLISLVCWWLYHEYGGDWDLGATSLIPITATLWVIVFISWITSLPSAFHPEGTQTTKSPNPQRESEVGE